MDLKDPEENLGVGVLRQAAEKTGEAGGDGTSTATILAHAIFSEGVRNVVAGASAIDLKRGLDRGVRSAISALKEMAKPLVTRQERAQVATMSAHNDIGYSTSLPPADGTPAELRIPLAVRLFYALDFVRDAAEKIDHTLPPPKPVATTDVLAHRAKVANASVGCHRYVRWLR